MNDFRPPKQPTNQHFSETALHSEQHRTTTTTRDLNSKRRLGAKLKLGPSRIFSETELRVWTYGIFSLLFVTDLMQHPHSEEYQDEIRLHGSLNAASPGAITLESTNDYSSVNPSDYFVFDTDLSGQKNIIRLAQPFNRDVSSRNFFLTNGKFMSTLVLLFLRTHLQNWKLTIDVTNN